MSMTATRDEVLCPELYFRLKKVFGKVYVSNRGIALITKPSQDGRNITVTNGENYRICCPWCGDTRFRLYIHHRWFENKNMANCFNETACTRGEAGRSRLDQLYIWLFGSSEKVYLPVKESKMTDEDIKALTEFRIPEGCVTLSSLPDNHEAVNYVRSRGYNPLSLEKYLGIGWITDQAIPNLRNRLFIPVYQDGKLNGFQARVINNDDPSRSRNKYINPIGMRKSTLLYNLNNAVNQNIVVICEGPADVWSVGPSGVAIFGSDCSHHQLSLIAKHFNGKIIAVALDADASLKADQLVTKLQHVSPRSFVTKIEMTGDEDPGALKSELWRRLHSNLTKAGVVMPEVITEWPNV